MPRNARLIVEAGLVVKAEEWARKAIQAVTRHVDSSAVQMSTGLGALVTSNCEASPVTWVLCNRAQLHTHFRVAVRPLALPYDALFTASSTINPL